MQRNVIAMRQDSRHVPPMQGAEKSWLKATGSGGGFQASATQENERLQDQNDRQGIATLM
jgi:hypothetical protein